MEIPDLPLLPQLQLFLPIQKRVYLAGPMRGIKDFNFPAFCYAARQLRANGNEVFSPVEHDEKVYGKGVHKSDTGNLCDITNTSFNLRKAMRADMEWISQFAEVIALLPGWETSKGATAERALGIALGLEIVQLTETRITDPITGGQKGQKLERFDLIPGEPMQELARVYGRGAIKYGEDNWRKGYSWRLSFGAMMRHAWLWWLGSPNDEKSNHHLACVMWHCCTLMTFERTHGDKDDRPDKEGK